MPNKKALYRLACVLEFIYFLILGSFTDVHVGNLSGIAGTLNGYMAVLLYAISFTALFSFQVKGERKWVFIHLLGTLLSCAIPYASFSNLHVILAYLGFFLCCIAHLHVLEGRFIKGISTREIYMGGLFLIALCFAGNMCINIVIEGFYFAMSLLFFMIFI